MMHSGFEQRKNSSEKKPPVLDLYPTVGADGVERWMSESEMPRNDARELQVRPAEHVSVKSEAPSAEFRAEDAMAEFNDRVAAGVTDTEAAAVYDDVFARIGSEEERAAFRAKIEELYSIEQAPEVSEGVAETSDTVGETIDDVVNLGKTEKEVSAHLGRPPDYFGSTPFWRMDDGSVIVLDKRKPRDAHLTPLRISAGGKHTLLSGSDKGEKIIWTPEGLELENKPEHMTEEELLKGLEGLHPAEPTGELPKIGSWEALREFNARVIEGGADALAVFDELLKRIDTEEERTAFIKNIEENFLLGSAEEEALEDSEQGGAGAEDLLNTLRDTDAPVETTPPEEPDVEITPETQGAGAEDLIQASEHIDSDETPFEIPPEKVREPSLQDRIAAFYPNGQRELTYRGKKLFISPDGSMKMRVGIEMKNFADGDVAEFPVWNSELRKTEKVPHTWNANERKFERTHTPAVRDERMDWEGRTPYDDVQ